MKIPPTHRVPQLTGTAGISPRRAARRAAAALVLGAALAAGCRQAPPAAPASPPQAPAPSAPSSAPPGAASPAPAPPGPKPKESSGSARAWESVKAWLKGIETDNSSVAEGALISEKELEPLATEGLTASFVTSTLPRNRQILTALRKLVKENKELNIVEWKPGKPSFANPGSMFSTRAALIEGSVLELLVGDESVVLSLTLLQVQDQWKIYRLWITEDEKEE